jgi:N-acyl-D-amino-acid deacylase
LAVYDLIIKNGFIVDGTSNPGFYGDIAIKGDSIAKIASEIDESAERVIDAEGKMVSPGFIDPHVHWETTILNDNSFDVFLKQGVTSVICGNCGHSVTPLDSSNVYEYYYKNGLITREAQKRYNKEQPKWSNFSEYCDVARNKGLNINMGII